VHVFNDDIEPVFGMKSDNSLGYLSNDMLGLSFERLRLTVIC
jgi:hypothetical protein